jgi:hypothetical protein
MSRTLPREPQGKPVQLIDFSAMGYALDHENEIAREPARLVSAATRRPVPAVATVAARAPA